MFVTPLLLSLGPMPATRKAQLLPSRILLVDDNHHGNAVRKSVLQEQGSALSVP